MKERIWRPREYLRTAGEEVSCWQGSELVWRTGRWGVSPLYGTWTAPLAHLIAGVYKHHIAVTGARKAISLIRTLGSAIFPNATMAALGRKRRKNRDSLLGRGLYKTDTWRCRRQAGVLRKGLICISVKSNRKE